jgi:hypothetical protein
MAAPGEYVGWVDASGARVIVRSETIIVMLRRKDGTFFVNSNGNREDGVKELNVFKSLEDAYVWMTLPPV